MRKSTAVIITLVLTLTAVVAVGALGIAVFGWGKSKVTDLLPDAEQPQAPPAPSEKVPNAPGPDNTVTRIEGPLGEPENPAADPKPTTDDDDRPEAPDEGEPQ